MHIYSKSIIQFVSEIKSKIKGIISSEVGYKVVRDRFYNARQSHSYPIKVVIFNNKSMLGYYDPSFYELGFNIRLMHAPKRQLDQVIRHEIAHYITSIVYGSTILPHGPEFKAFCTTMGWDAEVSSATICLEIAESAVDTEESAICRKVKKLMALAGSSNSHEAELAMIKSQQLLLSHNIEMARIDKQDDEVVVLKRILQQKKENAKIRAIARILETFFVSTVYNRSEEYLYLEILGSAANVEVAEYVAGVLTVEMELLWQRAQKESHLKGHIAKNSFFLGLARGYCEKIHALKREYAQEAATALMVIEKKLIQAQAMAYGRMLSSGKSSGRHCEASSRLGELLGKTLTINPALKHASEGGPLLLV